MVPKKTHIYQTHIQQQVKIPSALMQQGHVLLWHIDPFYLRLALLFSTFYFSTFVLHFFFLFVSHSFLLSFQVYFLPSIPSRLASLGTSILAPYIFTLPHSVALLFFIIKTLLSAILSFRPYSFVLSARSLEDFFRRPRLALNVTMFGKGCFEVDLFISCYENR